MTRFPAIAAFIRRDWQIDLSYRTSAVLELGTIIFFLASFYYLNRYVSSSHFGRKQGLDTDYFGYVAIGLSLFHIVQVSLATASNRLREEQTTGTFEALMAAPMSPTTIVLAGTLFGLLRAIVSGAIILGVAVGVFGARLSSTPGHVLVAALALVGCMAFAASIVLLLAAATVVLKKATALLGITLSLAALLAGVYFPIAALPSGIHQIADILPLTWALELVRASLLGGSPDLGKLGLLFGAAAVLFPIASAGLGAAMRHARRSGSLGAY